MIDENHPPDIPFYADHLERGLDPFHEDAFPDEFRCAGNKGKRRNGWFLVDSSGNQIGFVPDSDYAEIKEGGGHNDN